MNRRSFIKKMTMAFAGIFLLPTVTALARNTTNIVEEFQKKEEVVSTGWDQAPADILGDLRRAQEAVRRSGGGTRPTFIIPESVLKRCIKEGIL